MMAHWLSRKMGICGVYIIKFFKCLEEKISSIYETREFT